MPPQATFYSVAAGTNVLSGRGASQFMQTEYARLYNLQFNGIDSYRGPIELYWNGELAYSGPSMPLPGEGAVDVYLIGSGYRDALEIRATDGTPLAEAQDIEMIALDYADWSMIDSRDENGTPAYGAPEIPHEVAAAARARQREERNDDDTEEDDDAPSDPVAPPEPTPPVEEDDGLSQTVQTQDLAMYSLRFESTGAFDVYWNDELITSVAAASDPVFTQLYLEGAGSEGHLEIEPHEGNTLPTLAGYDLSLVEDEDDADLAALLAHAVPVSEDASGGAAADDPLDDMLLF